MTGRTSIRHCRYSIWAVFSLLLLASCKVEIESIEPEFQIVDVSWFEAEQTLFVFYDVQALAGLNDTSTIEIRYETDSETLDWTALESMAQVHTHLPVDCGATKKCGSASLVVTDEPRNVGLRLRYHRDGTLTQAAVPNLNLIQRGRVHQERSLLIYGVFDETNERIEWRSRHLFPTIRNEQARALGLRRYFEVVETSYGDRPTSEASNPFSYGLSCPSPNGRLSTAALSTLLPATFQPSPLPIEVRDAAAVCATSTVTDATGSFTTTAHALKNPETQPAFPTLRSPTQEADPIKFLLKPCQQTISSDHLEMQLQRLQFDSNTPVICTDNHRSPDFADQVAEEFRDAVEAARTPGRDMALSIVMHHDSAETLSPKVEAALEIVIQPELNKSTPRLTGAFVFDSLRYTVQSSLLQDRVLWCPAVFVDIDFEDFPETQEELEDIVDLLPDASQQSCPISPVNTELNLGNFSFTSLPILPTREIYLDFIDDYSKAQAGEMQEFTFVAPLRPTINENIDLGFGASASFINGESISADPTHAFSYCVDTLADFIVIRSELITDLVEPPSVLPLEFLPEWHTSLEESTYEIGLVWSFPYLLQLQYEAVLAGAVSAFALSVPFGIATTGSALYGSELWNAESFDLSNILTQCTRFCEHPTFDSAGVYQIREDFRRAYATQCFAPSYPTEDNEGFPDDP